MSKSRKPMSAALVLVLPCLLVVACGGGGGGGTPVSTVAPATPTGVQATPGNAQITVSWAAVTGADSYNVWWTTTAPAVPHQTTFYRPLAGNPFTCVDLTNGVPYYIVVTAQNAAGESGASTQVSATPAAPAVQAEQP